MRIPNDKFDRYVEEAFDRLPEYFKEKMNNVALLVDDRPTKDQSGKVRLQKNIALFGLFEGYGQSKRINMGPVLPDRITLFRKAIMDHCNNEEEIKAQIESTLRHEIAHHFGSDEGGAKKAGKIK